MLGARAARPHEEQLAGEPPALPAGGEAAYQIQFGRVL